MAVARHMEGGITLSQVGYSVTVGKERESIGMLVGREGKEITRDLLVRMQAY